MIENDSTPHSYIALEKFNTRMLGKSGRCRLVVIVVLNLRTTSQTEVGVDDKPRE